MKKLSIIITLIILSLFVSSCNKGVYDSELNWEELKYFTYNQNRALQSGYSIKELVIQDHNTLYHSVYIDFKKNRVKVIEMRNSGSSIATYFSVVDVHFFSAKSFKGSSKKLPYIIKYQNGNRLRIVEVSKGGRKIGTVYILPRP